ncbi:RHS repeat domain-containing protein, partial [Flavihumibacter sp.]|uniref:RHS repeat domain-containing protein n=1 Tax=Flavihumibacter sp. TaxID=1913981 RepID=UPI002FC82BCA
SVQFQYTATNANNSSASGINSLVANITQLIANSVSPSEVIKSGVSSLGSSLSSQTALANLLNTANTASGSNQAPKAYLHVLLFNDQFKFDAVNSKVIPVPYTVNSWGTLSRIGANAVSVKKNGYAYVYFSNESNELVYFDNFNLTHERGPVLEETHYYPFGLTMAGISSRAMGKLENRYKFNEGTELANREFSDGNGLDWYVTNYRMYDPQIGKFNQIDPLSILAFEYSPYSFASNNPLLFNDPFGLISTPENPEVLEEVIVTPANNRQQRFTWFGWSSTINTNFSRSLDQYSQRREAGLATVQPKDPSWYKADVNEYNMEKWHQNSMSARQFERQFYLIYFSALALPFLAPELAVAAPELIAAKSAVSATAQAVINGPSNINVLGIGADALLPFGSAAVVNGVASWRPFSANVADRFSYLGYNKGLGQASIDFGTSFIGGGIGERIGSSLPQVNGSFQKNVVKVSMGVPVAFGQEIGNMIITQKMSTQKQ